MQNNMFILIHEYLHCTDVLGIGTEEQCKDAMANLVRLELLREQPNVHKYHVEHSRFSILKYPEGVFSNGDWNEPVIYEIIGQYDGLGKKE